MICSFVVKTISLYCITFLLTCQYISADQVCIERSVAENIIVETKANRAGLALLQAQLDQCHLDRKEFESVVFDPPPVVVTKVVEVDDGMGKWWFLGGGVVGLIVGGVVVGLVANAVN